MKTITSIDPQEINRIIQSCKVCTLALVTPEGLPYAVPMNFFYEDSIVYLHSGPHGSKVEYIRHNPYVCISFTVGEQLVQQHPNVACSFSMRSDSVVLRGRVELIEGIEEKRDILNRMMRFYTGRQDYEFSQPSLDNVVLWRVKSEQATAKSLGLNYKEFQEREL